MANGVYVICVFGLTSTLHVITMNEVLIKNIVCELALSFGLSVFYTRLFFMGGVGFGEGDGGERYDCQ